MNISVKKKLTFVNIRITKLSLVERKTLELYFLILRLPKIFHNYTILPLV